jgi:hypothetical protein
LPNPIVGAGAHSRSRTFNAGVFVVDLDAWRARNVSGQLADWLDLAQRCGRRCCVLLVMTCGWLRDREPIFFGGTQPPMLMVLREAFASLPAEWHVRNLGWCVVVCARGDGRAGSRDGAAQGGSRADVGIDTADCQADPLERGGEAVAWQRRCGCCVAAAVAPVRAPRARASDDVMQPNCGGNVLHSTARWSVHVFSRPSADWPRCCA